MRGFCLRCQLLLHTVTLSGGPGQIELMLVVLLHGLFRQQDGIEQRTVPLASIFQRNRSALRADESAFLLLLHILPHSIAARPHSLADGEVAGV